jgi:hypothetical protein
MGLCIGDHILVHFFLQDCTEWNFCCDTGFIFFLLQLHHNFLYELSDDQSYLMVLGPLLQLTRGQCWRCGTVCPTSNVLSLDLMNNQS